MPNFTILIPKLKAEQFRHETPQENDLVLKHHNLSFLYGMYGSCLIEAEKEKSLLVRVDKALSPSFDFFGPLSSEISIVVDSDRAIMLQDSDGFGLYEELSLKATLLRALNFYWSDYGFVEPASEATAIGDKIKTVKRIRRHLEALLREMIPSVHPFSFPVAALTTSTMNLDESTQYETTFDFIHTTYLLSQPQLEDKTKHLDPHRNLLSDGSSRAASENGFNLAEQGQEGAMVRYGVFNVLCHEKADKAKIIAFFVKHSALFEFVCEYSLSHYNTKSDLMTLEQAAQFTAQTLVAARLEQRQMLAFRIQAAILAGSVVSSIKQKGG